MSISPATTGQRFVRRTSLTPDEYRTNFRQLDCDVIAMLTSDEASIVTAQMSKIYLSLINAPTSYWECNGVLRFAGEERAGEWHTAWEQLLSLVGVASATARKALAWMSEQAIIGYYAGRNGAGIRIFINRAASSIGLKSSKHQKNLHLVAASTATPHTSHIEACFNDSFAVLDSLDTDLNPPAPEYGAHTKSLAKTLCEPAAEDVGQPPPTTRPKGREVAAAAMAYSSTASMNELVERLRSELEPCVRSAVTQAAAQAATSEIARTREWFETKALPKAVRVAQRESYNLLRKHGTLGEQADHIQAGLQVGRSHYVPPEARLRTAEEIAEVAEMCVALLEVQGKAVDITLAEISTDAAGWLLPEDAPRVRERAQSLLLARSEGNYHSACTNSHT